MSRAVRVVFVEASCSCIKNHARSTAVARHVGVSTAVRCNISTVGVLIDAIGVEGICSPTSTELVVLFVAETILSSIEHVVVG
jgi:hypothetical protein